MGYRYGERKYSEGLYSRWPDQWHDKVCTQDDSWVGSNCETTPWQAEVVTGVWEKSVDVKEPWTVIPATAKWVRHG